MRKLFVAMLLITAAAITSAGTLTLSPVLINHQYQQTSNNPCVIGDPSCNNGTFAETIFPSPASAYDSVSPLYTVADIRGVVGNNLLIGLDINQTSVTQTLSLFTMAINGVVVDTYSASPATLVPPTTGGGNGNGYADYLLSGFTSLAGYNANDTVQFHVVMPIVDDGREEYFLISGTPTTVPEPATFVLLGGGLIAIAMFRRTK